MVRLKALREEVALLEAYVAAVDKCDALAAEMAGRCDKGGMLSVQVAVCEEYGVTLAEIMGHSKEVRLVVPRQMAMWLCRVITKNGLKEIGQAFGGKKPGTVRNAMKRAKEIMETEPGERSRVMGLHAVLLSKKNTE